MYAQTLCVTFTRSHASEYINGNLGINILPKNMGQWLIRSTRATQERSSQPWVNPTIFNIHCVIGPVSHYMYTRRVPGSPASIGGVSGSWFLDCCFVWEFGSFHNHEKHHWTFAPLIWAEPVKPPVWKLEPRENEQICFTILSSHVC